jgi:hypothetical protein
MATSLEGIRWTFSLDEQQNIIAQMEWKNQTACVEHDPVTGEPLMLRTSTGMQSLYVYDGTGNPAVLVTNASYRAFAYTYDFYGTFCFCPQPPARNAILTAPRWDNPTAGRFTQHDTLDIPCVAECADYVF